MYLAIAASKYIIKKGEQFARDLTKSSVYNLIGELLTQC
jgi:hypothetical protein